MYLLDLRGRLNPCPRLSNPDREATCERVRGRRRSPPRDNRPRRAEPTGRAAIDSLISRPLVRKPARPGLWRPPRKRPPPDSSETKTIRSRPRFQTGTRSSRQAPFGLNPKGSCFWRPAPWGPDRSPDRVSALRLRLTTAAAAWAASRRRGRLNRDGLGKMERRCPLHRTWRSLPFQARPFP